MTRLRFQNGFILIPVIIAIVLIATIAFMLNNQSASNVNQTGDLLQAEQAEQVALAGLSHATWNAQSSGCAGDMSMTSVPFGQDSYTATVDTGGATTSSYNFTPDRDTWIKEASPDENNAGDSLLSVKNKNGDSFRTLLHFDLSGIATTEKVQTATVWFYLNQNDTQGAITLHSITTDWTESDATWNTISNRFSSLVHATIPPQPVSGVWISLNITGLVQSWVNDPATNYGIMMNAVVDDLESRFASKEAASSQRPYLQIVTADADVSPLQISATGTLTGNPTPANDISRSLDRSNVAAYQPVASITLQPGPALEDTYINLDKPIEHKGAKNVLITDSEIGKTNASLLRFNVQALQGARVSAAELSLYLFDNRGDTSDVVQAHRLQRSWLEGPDGNNTGATWNTSDGVIPWTTAGGDYDPAVAGAFVASGVNAWHSMDISALVQGWLDGDYPNHGLILNSPPNTGNNEKKYHSGDAGDPGLSPRLSLTFSCECGRLCLAPQGSGNVLLVVGDPVTLSPDDAYKKRLFESWGYSIDLLDDDDAQAVFDSKFAINNVVYISASSNDVALATKFTTAPIGVVSEEGSLNDNLGFSSDRAFTTGATINVTDSSHFITALFPSGPLDIYSATMEQLTVSGSESPELQPLADQAGKTALAVLDIGAEMSAPHNGEFVSSRRVMLPLGREGSFNWDYLNNNGRLMVQRALQWGTGNTGLLNKKLLFVVSKADDPTVAELAYKALVESWGYLVELLKDDASHAEYAIAVANNEVVLLTADADKGKVSDKLVDVNIGVVTAEVELPDKFGFADNIDWDNGTAVEINDNSHYITSPFATGPLTVVASGEDLAYLTGTLAPGLGQLASTSSGYGVVTLDAGASMHNGARAAGRRVQLPWGKEGFDPNNLTADGATLLQRSLEWGSVFVFQPTQLLFVVADPSAVTAQEQLRIELIESWGYVVNLIDDNANQAAFDAAVAANDVAYVPTTIDATVLGTKLRAATIGVVIEIWTDDFGVATDFSDKNRDEIDIINNTHYITSPYSLGLLTYLSSLQPVTKMNSGYAPGLITLGEVFNTGSQWKPALAVLDTGDALAGGGNAAARRVQLPWGDSSFDFAALNDDGRTIMQRAIEWGLDEEIAVVAGHPGYNELFAPWLATNDGSWIEVDLGPLGVPANAVVEVAVVNIDAGSDQWGGVRATGSSLDRRLRLHESEDGGMDVGVMTVQADAASRIEYYSGKKDKVSFIVLGYWASGSYVEAWELFDASDDNSWQDQALSGYGVTPGDVAEILVFNEDSSNQYQGGVRTNGSTQNRRFDVHEAESGGQDMLTLLTVAGTDAGASIEIFAEDKSNLQFYLTGYWSTPPGVYNEAYTSLPGSPSVNATWEDINLSSLGVPANSVAQIVLANGENTAEAALGLREKGSILNRSYNLHEAEDGGDDFGSMHVNTDASSIIQWYDQDTAQDHRFYLLGWWLLP